MRFIAYNEYNKTREAKTMTAYQKFFLAYVKALKARNSAQTEADWTEANNLVKCFKKGLDKLRSQGV